MKNKRLPILFLLFVALSLLVYLTPYLRVDLFISQWVQKTDSVFFEKMMWFISYLGNQPTMVFLVGLVGGGLFLFGKRTEAVFSTLSAATGAFSGSLLKSLTNRPRPSSEQVSVMVWLSDKSYPSNHVLVFTIFFGFLLYLSLSKIKPNLARLFVGLLLLLPIATVGLSRIYLGAHWPSDVLGGYLFGVIGLIITINLYRSRYGQR